MTDLGPLVNKTVDIRFRGADIRLDLSHALFSSFDVDVGTRLLLKALGRDEVLASAGRILDVGAGVGVIGLAMAAAFPAASVTLRDRDLLAVAFSERNRLRNRLANARVEASLMGAGRAGGPWDYVLSNIPAKAGFPVIAAFLGETRDSLAPGGRLAIVVVKPLVDQVRRALAGAGFVLLAEERGSMHRAFVAEADAGGSAGPGGASAARLAQAGATPPDPFAPGAFDSSAYLRRRGDFKLFGRVYAASGYWGLPDFDTLGHPQLAAAELLSRFASGSPVVDLLVINPGPGHAAAWAALALGPRRIVTASRDLLSLVASRENLDAIVGASAAAGAAPVSEAEAACTELGVRDLLRLDEEAEGSYDLVLEFADPIPGYDWLGPTWERAARLLRGKGCFVCAAPPTELARLEKRRGEGWRLLGEKRKKGSAAAAWRRT